jgi:uncharacterized membrane protein YdjX (TVP38/TMEM64 family)/rhodanese-related sulfurtransferase
MRSRAVLPRLALVLAIGGAAVWLALNRDRLDPGLIESWIRNLGAWAPFGYVALFALGTVLFVPGAVFGLAGGVLFGPVWGSVLNLIGGTLGATLAFLVARYLAADWARRKAAGRLDRLIAGVEAEGWRFVAFVRLVPLFPFNLLNYALGLTRIPLLHYVIATLICMAPGTMAYTYLGYAGREAFAGSTTIVRTGLIALGLLALAVFIPRIARRMRAPGPGERRAAAAADVSWIEASDLADRLDRDPGPIVVDVRGPDEFRGALGHLRGARNIPLDDLQRRISELGEFRERELALVCRTQIRSAKAAALLKNAGFADARVLRGGMDQWNKIGLPVEDRAAQLPSQRRISRSA